MEKLTEYKKLKSGENECLSVIKNEIHWNISCKPFATKLINALKDLKLETEQDELKAANVLMSGLQTLKQCGIIAEDYDKIDFVKRGNTIVPSARVEAFYKACARKGYQITDKIIAVPKEDSDTTYFNEIFYNGDYRYPVEDKKNNPDRAVTAQRLIDRYFSKFMCRLTVKNAQPPHNFILEKDCEMSIDDMLMVASSSEQGLFKSKWEEYTNGYGRKAKRKVITDELNEGAIWVKWTGEMVKKSIIRRALKRIKESLPELTESIYAFEQDEYIEPVEAETTVEIEIPVESEDINLNKLTAEQREECNELFDLYRANPKLAEDKFLEIKKMIDDGESPQDIINKEYASLSVLKLSKAKWEQIGGYFVTES
ncbi:MAG: hypothetical protein II306_07040 [Clostridia bacterium]|nr:hypothetical protein [Clostridia bacterium]